VKVITGPEWPRGFQEIKIWELIEPYYCRKKRKLLLGTLEVMFRPSLQERNRNITLRNLETGGKGKGKSVPLQAWSCPGGSRKLRFPDYVTTAQDGANFVSNTHRSLLPPGNAPGTHFSWRLSRPQGHSAIGRIMSMKNSNDTIWDRTSDLPICSTAP